jgi:enediyne biosynthesis protein E4
MRLSTLCTALIGIACSCETVRQESARKLVTPPPLFTLMDPNLTGVSFENRVDDTEEFNILTYRNYYNGGGIAIGDINNDSLPDLYFTSNQHSNRLYLNKGNFVFEDITESAGVAGTKKWSTGVTMADINGDGYLDIYVCNAGDFAGKQRENELYINNGNLTFTESAKKFNLDNDGYSTHAAFFDYDNDGDLDCYILNNSFKDPAKIELYKKVRERPDDGGDKLMRNDGGLFTDVTVAAGIYSSLIGFGLGISVADVNDDGLPDLYVSNDFWERDYLYINKGHGKFSEELIERISYCPVSSMGSDIADLNNDGYPEIFTTDMLPGDNRRLKTTIAFDPYHLEDAKYRANFHYQMIQNCLQLNRGDGHFQEIALLSGVAATDWSWAALLFDFDNDGLKDIFVSNGIARDIMSMDFREFLGDSQQRSATSRTHRNLELIRQIPSQPLSNYAFRNKGSFFFDNDASLLGLAERSFSNGSAYGDLDNDGDLDLVVNNLNQTAFIYRNENNTATAHNYLKVYLIGNKSNRFGIGAKVRIQTKAGLQVLENQTSRGFQSSIEPVLLFGLNTEDVVDELEVSWPDGKIETLHNIKANKKITLYHSNAIPVPRQGRTAGNPLYEEVSAKVIQGEALHLENEQNDFDYEVLLHRMLSSEGPRMIFGDVNNDDLEDLILLGAKDDPDKLYIQDNEGRFRRKKSPSFEYDKNFESTCGVFIDYDNDGDADLLIGSGGYEPKESINYIVRLYINDGKGNFLGDPQNIPPVVGNFSTIIADDFNNDGMTDIFLGARVVPGNYGLPPRSYLLINDFGNWVDVAPDHISNVGMVTDAVWSDVDNDGDNDLIVVGDWMPITIFTNENGAFNQKVVIEHSSGWWNRIAVADLDLDGRPDIILGNWGLNTKFKATDERPLSMNVNDFDQNGKSEFIISWYPPLDSLAYPFAPKPELTSQIPALRKKILKYADYADLTYRDMFSQETISTSYQYRAVFLQSAVLWNDGQTFTLKALPADAQISPVFAILAEDMDDDGLPDLWLGGNFYALKPQVGRHDASRGVFLKGSKGRTFISDGSINVVVPVTGEVRDARILHAPVKQVFVARNNASLLIFRKKK